MMLRKELQTHFLYEELEQRRHSYSNLILPEKQRPDKKEKNRNCNFNMMAQLWGSAASSMDNERNETFFK